MLSQAQSRISRPIRLTMIAFVVWMLAAGTAAAEPLAFAPNFPTSNLALMEDDGTGRRDVPNTVGGLESVLSPDRKRLVFVAADPNFGNGPLYVINVDGTNKRLLYGGTADSPDWSPDGRWIVVHRRLRAER